MLQRELDAQKCDLEALRKDKDRWQEHTKRLVQQLHTIDPKEHENVKKKAAEQEEKIKEQSTQVSDLQAQVVNLTSRRPVARSNWFIMAQHRRPVAPF